MFQVIAAGHEIPKQQAKSLGSLVKRTAAFLAIVVTASLALAAFAPTAWAAEASQQTADTTQASIARLTVSWNTYVFDDLTNSWTKLAFASECSGFVADPDGYLVTAGHCLDPVLAADTAIELRAKALFRQNTEFFESKDITLEQLTTYGLKNWDVEGKAEGSEPQPRLEVVLPGGEDSDDPVTFQGEVLDVDATNDIALIEIEATGLPSLELADESGIEIGESVFAVGFPALRDSVTDPSLRPTFKSGSISDTGATRDRGEVPIYETSAPMSQGMSGGPTVNAEGEVVGVNSYGTTLNNDFNWIAPSHLVDDMLVANGIAPELGQTDVLFRQALDAFYSGDYRTAAAKLQAVLGNDADHPVALGLIEEAEEAAKSQPLSQPGGINLPLLPVGIAAAIVATLGVSFLMGRSFARRVGHDVGTPNGMAMAIPAPPAISRPAPVTPKLTDPIPVQTVPANTTPVGFQPPMKAETPAPTTRFCTGCGSVREPGAHFCRNCGANVG